MFNPIKPFSETQITFLEDNFVVFDPTSGETYREFNMLKDVKVILMGEYHHTQTIDKIQRKFFELFLNSSELDARTACLLLEGIASDIRLTTGDLTCFNELSEKVEIRGSDARSSTTKLNIIKYRALKQKISEFEVKNSQHSRQVARQIAELLNKDYLSGLITVESNKHMFIPPIDKHELDVLYTGFDPYIKSLNAWNKEAVGLVETNGNIDFQKSNQGLFGEIEKAAKQFSKVLAVWGMNHYLFDDEFCDHLNAARITFMVLLPNEARRSEAYEEYQWQMQTINKITFVLDQKLDSKNTNSTTYTFPQPFQKYFHPMIQRLCISQEETPIVLDRNKLLSLCNIDSTIVIPKNRHLHLHGFSSFRYKEFIAVIGQNMEQEISLEDSLLLNKQFILAISDMLLFSNHVLDSIIIPGGSMTIVERDLRPVLSFKSTNQIVLKTSSTGAIVGNIKDILREMQRHQMTHYEVKKGKALLITDITEEDLTKILADPNKHVDRWFMTKLPYNMRGSFSGNITFSPGKRTFENIVMEGLLMETDSSFKINLTQKK